MLVDAGLGALARQKFGAADADRQYFHAATDPFGVSVFPAYGLKAAYGNASHRPRNRKTDPAPGKGAGPWAALGAPRRAAPDQEEGPVARAAVAGDGRGLRQGENLLALRQCRYCRSLYGLHRRAARSGNDHR